MDLAGLHPDLITKMQVVLKGMADLGFPMRVCQGVRSAAEQRRLYAQGRTTPGRIVTNCDGVLIKSPHQAAADGSGHAVDCCFLGPDPFSLKLPWDAYGRLGEAQRLVWGGRFKLADYDHLQLP